MIAEITNGMESIRLPSEDRKNERMESVLLEAAAEGQANVVSPQPNEEKGIRPFDVVRSAGPAQHPIPFPPPIIERGVRDNVLCYNQRTQRFIKAENVLFRDYSRDVGDADSALQRVDRAFWPVPHKEKIKTIMGYVQICVVLKRCPRERDEDDSSSDEDGEEDIVFQVTKEYVAIKVNYCDRMERMKNKHAEDPLKEIAAMQLIGDSHPNVIGCSEVLFDGRNLNVVMPYCGRGDLFSYLQDSQRIDLPQPGLPEDEAKVLFRQMMSGLKCLHSKGICHRDISPENIMMNGDGCLIIDMGMCLRIPYTDPSTNGGVTDITRGTQKRLLKPQGACGKLPYMSPEIYRNRDDFDGEAVDVWTVGTILFCMLSGNRSYETPHKSDAQFYWMTHGLTTLLNDWGVDLSNDAIDLLQGMLKLNPRDRLTIQEIENHPWYAEEKLPATAHSICRQYA
eukprot:CAMPEP_0202493764 /NCGR_PEP_ID=MMETSP1361-20130828/9977_1 /ASSEMBLY_ACC=CAM_ASM_000849 /TAXON_ID=210615 /ORGANISM="Staurosira complex sp., Strain CCMP2646" /LENGTH=451 /DNA_ID=CAMNT_0049124115 /DNA_START=208 /DNA_END=1563 /DNA_ORIENTATION=+